MEKYIFSDKSKYDSLIKLFGKNIRSKRLNKIRGSRIYRITYVRHIIEQILFITA